MRNVLIIACAWPPSYGSSTWRLLGFAKYLPQYGWNASVLTFGGIGNAQTSENLVGNRTYRQNVPSDAVLERILDTLFAPAAWITRKDAGRYSSGILRRIREILSVDGERHSGFVFQFIARALALLRSERFDSVYVSAPPHNMAIVAGVLARRTSVPVVLNLVDPWTQNILYPYRGLWDRVLRVIERAALRSVSRIIVLTPGQQKMLTSRYPFVRRKIACVPDGFDPDDFSAHPNNAPEDKFVLVHLGRSYDRFEDVLRAVELNVRRDSDFASRFLLRWVGKDRGAASKAAQSIAADSFEFTGVRPKKEALSEGARATALWPEVPLADKARFVIRGKTYEYLALCRPILGTVPATGSTRDLLKDFPGCRFISSRHPEDIAVLLKDAFVDWKMGRLRIGWDQGRLQPFRWGTRAGQLADVLDDAVERRRLAGHHYRSEGSE